jgi:hypothetical protein
MILLSITILLFICSGPQNAIVLVFSVEIFNPYLFISYLSYVLIFVTCPPSVILSPGHLQKQVCLGIYFLKFEFLLFPLFPKSLVFHLDIY